MTKSLMDRFEAKVNKIPFHDCWEWAGAKMAVGYGYISDENGKDSYAHRVSWRLHRGEIPHGMCVLHKCDNRMCVNPDHLFLGTRAENMVDAASKNRIPHGDGHWNTKIKEADIPEIKAMLDSGKSHTEIARRFGVGRQTIGSIANGRIRVREMAGVAS